MESTFDLPATWRGTRIAEMRRVRGQTGSFFALLMDFLRFGPLGIFCHFSIAARIKEYPSRAEALEAAGLSE